MDRGQQYLEAGAHALFIEAPASREQMATIGSTFGQQLPLVHNLVEGGGSPIDDPAELAQLGYRIALYPAALLHQFVPGAQRLLEGITQTGHTLDFRDDMYELSDMNRILGADELLETGKRFEGKS